MAQIHWSFAVNGPFDIGTFWSTGTVPGPADDAILDAVGRAGPVNFTVTSSVSQTVLGIQTIASATLFVSAGGFFATAGTDGGVNAGTILVGDNASFEIGGTFANTGAVSIFGGANLTRMIIATGGASLTGAGHVTLSNNLNNEVFGAVAGVTLTNFDNLISGAGQIGLGQLTLVNDAAGIIEATGANALIIDTANALDVNSGLMEAVYGALVLQVATIDQSGGGTLLAATGEVVALQNATVIGGVLQTAGAGAIQTQSGVNLLDGQTSTVTNQGLVEILNNTLLEIGGAIDNTGAIDMFAGANTTRLVVTANAVLSGAGQITLDDDGNNVITAAATGVSLTNVDNVISGAGYFGQGQLLFVNDAGGALEATGDLTLVFDTGAQTAINNGLMEALAPGGLRIASSTIDQSGGGAILAAANAYVGLQSADIIGGLVDGAGGGVVKTLDAGSLLDGRGAHPVTVLGNLTVVNNTALTVVGAIDLSKTVNGVTSTGTITLAAGANLTDLSAGQANATVIGGAVLLDDDPDNAITGVVTFGQLGPIAVSSLTNRSFISGAGTIGTNLRLINNTTIEADGVNALVIATGNAAVAGSDTVTNNGLLEAANPLSVSGPGGLALTGGVIANTLGKGVILAAGATTHVDLRSVTIRGGTLETTGGGVIQTLDAGSLLDGAAASVTNQGLIELVNNTALTVVGGLDNLGQIDLLATANATDLKIGLAGATLTGAGQVILGDDANNRLYGVGPGAVLTNVDNTISGAGQLGLGQLGLINQTAGVIDATGAAALILNTGAVSVANLGLIEATGTGGLLIQGATVDDSKGGVLLAANGSLIGLQTADIVGGHLKTAGTGAFQTADAGSVLDGTAAKVTLSGLVKIANNTALTVVGALNNLGRIQSLATANTTDLKIGAPGATLTGAGQVILSDDANNRLYGVAGAVLTNVDNTISGAGQLGLGQLKLINQAKGVIDADGATALILDTGSVSVANFGLIEATGTGGLDLLATTIDDSAGGVILAAAGSSVGLQSADIIGGALETAGSGVIETLDGGSVIDGAAASVTIAGLIELQNNMALTIDGRIDNLGQIESLATANATDLKIGAAGATLTGAGQVILNDDANNRLYGVSGAVLTNVDNTISGAGQLGLGQLTLINQVAGRIEATGANALILDTGAIKVANAGLIEAIGTGGLLIQSTTVDDSKGGDLLAGNGSLIALQNADLVGGTLKTVGTGDFQVQGGVNLLDGSAFAVRNLGAVDIRNDCQLEIAGVINNLGALSIDATANATELQVKGAASLTGGGQVKLADDPNSILGGDSAAAVLTNVNNVISGAGQIGASALTLVNAVGGIIDASGAAALTLNASGVVTNAGMIEATGAGGLILACAVNGAGGGTILAAAGAAVTLQGAAIQGGRLSRTGSGRFVTFGAASLLDGTKSAVTNQAEIDIANNTALDLAGTIANAGTLALQASANLTELIVSAASASLTGAGQLTLTDNANNLITGAAAADTLVNVANTISGAGRIGGGVMTLVNRSAGLIDGNGANRLVIDTGARTVINAGKIEATGAGGVAINSAVANSGILEVDGGNLTVAAAVTGAGSAVIHSGVITFAGGFSEAARFTGISGTLALAQSQAYAGVVSGFSTHGALGADFLDLEDVAFVGVGEGTFKGTSTGGTLTVTDGTHIARIALAGNYTRSGFVASSDGHGGTLITLGKRLPVALADAYTDQPSTPLTVTAAAGVLANDIDPNGLTLSAVLAGGGAPAHGTLVLNADGSFTYTPNRGFKGPDSFTYIARDADGSSAPTTVNLAVGAGGPPVAQADAYKDAAGHTLTVTAANGVLANDTDPNGLPLTATLAPGSGPAHGVLKLNADGSFTYTPTLGFAGTDAFQYIAGDSLSAAAPTTVTLTVAAAAPTTKADAYGDAAGHALAISAAKGVLANDADPNGLGLTAALANGGGPAHGSLTLNADGSFTYTPTLGFAGTDTFRYIAADSLAASAPTTVTLTVTAGTPTAKADAYGDAAGHALAVTAAKGVLANDTDPNGLPLTAALASGGAPTHGTLTLNADGSFSYTPTLGFAGTDSFRYIASDSLAASAPTTVTLTVTAAAPASQADAYSDTAGQVLAVTAANGVLANDTDPNGLPLTATVAPGLGPQHGILTLNKDGSFTYTPAAGFAGVDSFDYIAADALQAGQPTLVTLNVTATPPITRADSYAAIANQTLTVDAAHGVLANDTDPNGLKLTAALAPGGAPEYGVVTLNADGSFSYILNSGFGGFNGVDTFSYIACDGVIQSAPTTVTIDVSNGAASLAAKPAAVLAQFAAGVGGKGVAASPIPHAASAALRPLIVAAGHATLS